MYSLITYWSNPFSQDHKGSQFELCLPRILPEAGAEGQHQPWERTEARMGVRLLGRAMLGQTVVPARKSHARPDGCGGHHLRFCENGLDQ